MSDKRLIFPCGAYFPLNDNDAQWLDGAHRANDGAYRIGVHPSSKPHLDEGGKCLALVKKRSGIDYDGVRAPCQYFCPTAKRRKEERGYDDDGQLRKYISCHARLYDVSGNDITPAATAKCPHCEEQRTYVQACRKAKGNVPDRAKWRKCPSCVPRVDHGHWAVRNVPVVHGVILGLRTGDNMRGGEERENTVPADLRSRARYLELAEFCQQIIGGLSRYTDGDEPLPERVLEDAVTALNSVSSGDPFKFDQRPSAALGSYEQVRTLEEASGTPEVIENALRCMSQLLTETGSPDTKSRAKEVINFFVRLQTRALWNFEQPRRTAPPDVGELCRAFGTA